MDTACIARCMGIAFFAASLQAVAGPPEGKGKPAHAGASPFVRFPVPEHSVGVVRHTQGAAAAELRAPGLAAKDFHPIPSAKIQGVGRSNALGVQSGTGVVGANPAILADVALAPGSKGFPAGEKKAAPPECGAR